MYTNLKTTTCRERKVKKIFRKTKNILKNHKSQKKNRRLN